MTKQIIRVCFHKDVLLQGSQKSSISNTDFTWKTEKMPEFCDEAMFIFTEKRSGNVGMTLLSNIYQFIFETEAQERERETKEKLSNVIDLLSEEETSLNLPAKLSKKK